MPHAHKPCRAPVPGLSPHRIGCGPGMAQPLQNSPAMMPSYVWVVDRYEAERHFAHGGGEDVHCVGGVRDGLGRSLDIMD